MARNPWTPAEDQVLRELAGKQSCTTIGSLVGRPRQSVHDRLQALGLPTRRLGEHHPMAKLSNLQAAMLSTLLDAGFSATEIKQALPDLPVTAHTIADIGRCASWAHLPLRPC